MKKFLSFATISFIAALLFITQVNLSSCNKETTAIKTDTVTVAPVPSTMALLTGKEWFFDTVYTNYTGAGTGILSYARGSSNNLADLDDIRYVYWPDGTEDAFNANSTTWYSQTWQFTNSDSTELYYPSVPARTIPVYQRIIKLTTTDLIIYDSTDNAYFHQVPDL
jgi:hypothetical protein